MGGVVHFEIPADDQERARSFYKEALGWRIDPVPGMDYNMVVTTPMDETTGQPTEAGAINGGMMAREADLTNPVLTVDVEDIEATLKTVEPHYPVSELDARATMAIRVMQAVSKGERDPEVLKAIALALTVAR